MTQQNNIPTDMDALLAWLKEQALVSHTTAVYSDLVKNDPEIKSFCLGRKDAFDCVIAKIENSRINQRPHLPQGWDGV